MRNFPEWIIAFLAAGILVYLSLLPLSNTKFLIIYCIGRGSDGIECLAADRAHSALHKAHDAEITHRGFGAFIAPWFTPAFPPPCRPPCQNLEACVYPSCKRVVQGAFFLLGFHKSLGKGAGTVPGRQRDGNPLPASTEIGLLIRRFRYFLHLAPQECQRASFPPSAVF